MNAEEQGGVIAALLEERRALEVRGDKERLAQVDAELKRLGAAAETAQKRAARRPSSRKGGTR